MPFDLIAYGYLDAHSSFESLEDGWRSMDSGLSSRRMMIHSTIHILPIANFM